ncbi:hypothetical protein GCM10010191_70300 [Actinomadura vinacea]|uniref:DUF2946 domain-containing protein n=1 Tax=Actinomadura vinacea TaxID=115336 RepID=A0ABP5X317_9ACTN
MLKTPARDRATWTLLLGLALACCVMAMHGFQASNSPMASSGMPDVSAVHAPAGGAATERGTSHSDRPHDPEQHAGGEICLALLALSALAALLLLVLRVLRPGSLLPRTTTTRARPRGSGRSPPPLTFRSAVLRL